MNSPLRPETAALWSHLADHPGLARFILVGGTALALHLQHRTSDDLDFMIPEIKLPRGRLRGLIRSLEDAGYRFAPNDRAEDLAEFEDSGLQLLDIQQNFVVHAPGNAGRATKVTFVAPDRELRMLLLAGQPLRPRVASVEEIFHLKCIACANRTRTRDWFDLYVLLSRGLFQPMDMVQAFALAGVPGKLDIALLRLCSGRVPADDEGYQPLMDEPPSIAQMQALFESVRDTIETEKARLRAMEVAAERHRGP